MSGRASSLAMGLLLVLAFAAGWAVNGWRADARVALVESSQSKKAQAQAQQAQAAIEKKAVAVLDHAAAQQENTHDFTQKLAALQAGRAADAARIAGLQHDIRAAATRNAQLAGDAAACRDLADQHQRLAALAGEGAGVVGQLVGLVERRDAQVAALKGLVQADRQLLTAN
ncbi:MAG: hypothetical protein LBJ15_22350 [Comamonas sp.]|jgi:hypothetical protein|uniref:hypothetical protein n=1 Tax=Comamonas sp. TaxID=34028 RepID=UPI00283275E3|nr:hypothetical protein [Comamonas sp.]MDR0216726.1 hypothetical protein [Comamonas sp.]